MKPVYNKLLNNFKELISVMILQLMHSWKILFIFSLMAPFTNTMNYWEDEPLKFDTWTNKNSMKCIYPFWNASKIWELCKKNYSDGKKIKHWRLPYNHMQRKNLLRYWKLIRHYNKCLSWARRLKNKSNKKLPIHSSRMKETNQLRKWKKYRR